MEGLSEEQIKAAANSKLQQLKAEARDTACDQAFGKIMGGSILVATTMAVCLPIGAMAGMAGLVAWGAVAAGAAVGGLLYANREAKDIYQGDEDALDRWLSDEAWAEIADRADKVRSLAQDAVKKPEELITRLQQQTTSPHLVMTEDNGLLPIAPCRLDDAAPHLFLVGRTREGKSETLKHLIGGEKRVWYVTIKQTDMAPSHWRAYRVGGRDLAEQMAWLIDQWDIALNRHLDGRDNEPEWFVIDEIVAIMRSLETKGYKELALRLKGIAIELVTAGAAVGAFIGLLSQTGNSGPIGIDLDLLKNFSVVACGKRKKPQAIAAFEKLTEMRLTPNQRAQVMTQPSYFQLWEMEGAPALSVIDPTPLTLAPVKVCPQSDLQAARIDAPAEKHPAEDWVATANFLVTCPETSLRKAAVSWHGGSLSIPKWQAWRDELKETMCTLPVDLQDALRAKYVNVLL